MGATRRHSTSDHEFSIKSKSAGRTTPVFRNDHSRLRPCLRFEGECEVSSLRTESGDTVALCEPASGAHGVSASGMIFFTKSEPCLLKVNLTQTLLYRRWTCTLLLLRQHDYRLRIAACRNPSCTRWAIPSLRVLRTIWTMRPSAGTSSTRRCLAFFTGPL